MLDPKTLLPMIKKLLPNESDADIMAGIKEFAKAHPDLGNKDALQALITALKQMQGGGQGQPQQPPQQQPSAAPPKPFGQNMLGSLPQGVK
jgi:hypothetical protein